MRIFKEDCEEVKKCKREINIVEMAKDHRRSAEKLPLGLPKECKVDQPRDLARQERPPNYHIGDTQFTNGLVWI